MHTSESRRTRRGSSTEGTKNHWFQKFDCNWNWLLFQYYFINSIIQNAILFNFNGSVYEMDECISIKTIEFFFVHNINIKICQTVFHYYNCSVGPKHFYADFDSYYTSSSFDTLQFCSKQEKNNYNDFQCRIDGPWMKSRTIHN